MKRVDYIPEDYDRIAIVDNEDSLFDAEFKGRINCILRPRFLIVNGDFNGLAGVLYNGTSANEQRYDKKKDLYKRLARIAEEYDPVGRAANFVKRDVDMLRGRHLEDNLRVIGPEYYSGTPSVHGLHMDHGTGFDDMGVVMCSYTEPTTVWIRNEDCGVGLPIYGRKDPVPVFSLNAGAKTHHFQPGDMTRHAMRNNFNGVAGFIHAAEVIKQGQYRLLLAGYGINAEPMLP